MKSGWRRDYEPFELAENMEEDLGLFEAATHAHGMDLQPIHVGNVLAATAFGAECLDFARVAAGRLSVGLVNDATSKTASSILSSAMRSDAGLVVVPGGIGSDVLSALVDGDGMHASLAIAVVSGKGSTALDAMLLPLFDDEPAARTGLAWACTLAAAAGPQGLVAAVELSSPTTRQQARRLAGDAHDPEEVRRASVGRAVSARLGSLVAALQKHALSRGYAVRVSFHPGWPRREILNALTSLARSATVILGRDGLPAAQGHGPAFRLALELVEERAEAVLIV